MADRKSHIVNPRVSQFFPKVIGIDWKTSNILINHGVCGLAPLVVSTLVAAGYSSTARKGGRLPGLSPGGDAAFACHPRHRSHRRLRSDPKPRLNLLRPHKLARMTYEDRPHLALINRKSPGFTIFSKSDWN